ncbi:hypothetical protein MINS_22230 [Mycolicibacterium insubricum]|uniref:Uncharacterized protein n=1 Tax=Mycolicibacterium insubricum TaxID=444597 RepID=A0A1X0DJU0_9MYCO|nr:hypothetical protein BST26_04805 [Mycolicibacterium insubricum]BBZ66794.1 hypothetical protein MINS_22230 [Mycolicibacterium insubricum]
MLTAIAIVPSPPVLVPELAGGGAAEFAGLRAAVAEAAAALPPRWLAVGVAGDAPAVFGTRASGTFAGYGADVPVALSGHPDPAVRALPLCALITGWIRGQSAPQAVAEVRCWPADTPDAAAVAAGAALRAELDATGEPIGVLVVADGLTTLTPSAPGGHDPASVPLQQALDDALATGDTARLAVPPPAAGRTAYAVLSGLAGPGPHEVHQLYRDAPLGVGYFVGVWRFSEARRSGDGEGRVSGACGADAGRIRPLVASRVEAGTDHQGWRL